MALVHYVLPEMVILSRAFDDEHAKSCGTPAPIDRARALSIGDTMSDAPLKALAPKPD